jgi:hypothetical protein
MDFSTRGFCLRLQRGRILPDTLPGGCDTRAQQHQQCSQPCYYSTH